MKVKADTEFDASSITLPREITGTVQSFRADLLEPRRRQSDDTDDYILDLRLCPSGLALGEYRKTVWIDRRNGAAVLVRAEIVGDIAVTPLSFYYGVVSAGDDRSRTVALTSRSDTPFRILGIEAGELPVRVYAKGGSSPGARHELEARLRLLLAGDRKRSLVNGSVTVRTDLPSQPRVEIPVFALYAETARLGSR